MKTILITGINGFLGSNIAKRLSGNFNIVGTEFSLDNLFRLKEFDFSVYLSDREHVKKLFAENKVDIVVHTATFYGRDNEDIVQLFESNLSSPLHLLDMSIKNNVELFINTDSALEKFMSPYSLTKQQFHDWLYFRSKEIKTVNMQLEHFYGPGCSNTNFVTAMIEKLKNNEPYVDLTKGEQKRDFIYYADVVAAYEFVISKKEKLNEYYNNFEIGTGNLITIKEIMLLLKRLTNSKTQLNFGAVPYRENELMESKSNNENLVKLGWTPTIGIEEGIFKTINEIQ